MGLEMTKEDIEFLKDLQHEINTQETDGQADPRFWVVNQSKRDWGFESGYADDIMICNCDGDTWETTEEFLDYLVEDGYLYKSEIDENYDYNFDEILALLDNSDFYICGYRDEDSIVSDTFFLTKRACEQHIEQNGYHYSKPHTYAMTAWRSPEYERFMKIFKSLNLDGIEVTSND